MTAVTVAIPVLGRPHRIEPLLASLEASQGHLQLHPCFVVSPGDHEQRKELQRRWAHGRTRIHIVGWDPGVGDYAKKINAIFAISAEPWFFAGADDLHFHPGWADEAVRVAEETGAGMVGTNDLGNAKVMAGQHATHSLFRRSYVEECGVVDAPGQVYCELYDHQFVDTESYETALARGCFAFASESRVEHLHPFWGKGEMDATYRKGLAAAAADRTLHQQRRRLWA